MEKNLVLISILVVGISVTGIPKSGTNVNANKLDLLKKIVSSRRIRYFQTTLSLSRAFELLDKNRAVLEKRLHGKLIEYVGGEENFEKLIQEFEISSPFEYGVKDRVLKISGYKDIENFRYRVDFLIFFDETGNKINEIKVSVQRQGQGYPNRYFIKLPTKYWQRIEEIINIYPESTWLGENYVLEAMGVPIGYGEEAMNALRSSAQGNPIIHSLITKRKFIDAGLVIQAEICTYLIYAAAFDDGSNVILRSRWEPFEVGVFAHEFYHFVYHNKLFETDTIESVFARYISEEFNNSKIIDITSDITSYYGLEVTESDIESIKNIFTYMYKFHPNLVQYIIERHGVNKFSMKSILENHAIANLFGTFADPENKGLMKDEFEKVVTYVRASDVEIFADLGLIPDWMRPSQLGYTKDIIDEEYYQLIKGHLG